MASLLQWTWVWASSRRWWRTGKPGILQSMGLQRVRHNWPTEQQQQILFLKLCFLKIWTQWNYQLYFNYFHSNSLIFLWASQYYLYSQLLYSIFLRFEIYLLHSLLELSLTWKWHSLFFQRLNNMCSFSK